MSETAAPRFRPHRMIRSLLGPIFGVACFLATLTGVVVLVVLLGSILYAALKGKPDNPWYAIGANLRELWEARQNGRAEPPVERSGGGGLPGRHRRQSLVTGLGHAPGDTGGSRGGRLPRGIRASGPAAADHPDQHRQPGRRALDRLWHPRPGPVRASIWRQGPGPGPLPAGGR